MIYSNPNQFEGQAPFGTQRHTRLVAMDVAFKADSAIAAISTGAAVKLVDVAGKDIPVDVCSGPTDGPFYGVVAAQPRQFVSPKGSKRSIYTKGAIVNLISSAAFAVGTKLTVVAPTYTDGVLTETALVRAAAEGEYIIGVALNKATASGQIVPVEIDPSATAVPAP